MSKNIVIESTCEVFSSNSGIFLLEELWKSLRLDRKFRQLLPKKKKQRGILQIDKLKALVFSFALGNDSLSDIDDLRDDQLFQEAIGGQTSSTSMGDFLRSFDKRNVERLQDKLLESVIELRFSLYPDDQKFVIAMDSTPHEHYSKKMEGLAWNYKNMWCLDSQNAYDQYGFSYLFDLRPGNTFSANDSEYWIDKIFSKIPSGAARWFRADSAYGKNVVFETLKNKNVNYAIALKGNIGRYVRKKNRNLLKWKKTKLQFFDSKECEVGMGIYPLKNLGNLRVVFIRAPKQNIQLDLLEDLIEDGYVYYSIITNVSQFDLSDEGVIDFYRGRATAENFIKEQKYGYDFLNFPCQRLRSNQVFGLAGSIAHNLMRALSFMMEQKTVSRRGKDGKLKKIQQSGYYAKTIRKKLIHIAGKVACSARKVKLRLSRHNWEVYEKIMKNLTKVKQRYIRYNTLSELFKNQILKPS